MESIRNLQKKYSSRALVLSIFAALFCMMIDQIPVGKGFLLGTLFSIINFILMGETLPYRLGRSKRKTFFISLGSIWFRYVILAVPLVVAIKNDRFNLFSVIFGIFSVQIILFADHLFAFLLSARKKQI